MPLADIPKTRCWYGYGDGYGYGTGTGTGYGDGDGYGYGDTLPPGLVITV